MTQLTLSALLTNTEAACHLGIQPSTLAVWRCEGRYPIPYLKVGRRTVRYRREDLDAWLKSQIVRVGDGCDDATD